jgi:hypothetical protein
MDTMNISLPPAVPAARLRYRAMLPSDLAECLPLLPAHLGLSAAQRDAVAALWPRLMNEASMIVGVIEDTALPVGQRVQGWGATIILPSAYVLALEIDSAPRAHLSRRIYADLLSGELVPMSDRQIGQANAGGELNLFVLHFSTRRTDLSDPYLHRVVATANDAFRAFHDGYQLRAIYYENSAAAEQIALQSGFNVRRLVDAHMLQHMDTTARPALYTLTREEARLRLPGTPARNSFEFPPPRFRFNASQRRLLWHALFDDSDDTLLPALEVSTHGLKKLWRGIYERIEDVAPDFFGEGDTDGGDDGKRGPEKRRQVLAYVRQRPEELRPWAVG